MSFVSPHALRLKQTNLVPGCLQSQNRVEIKPESERGRTVESVPMTLFEYLMLSILEDFIGSMTHLKRLGGITWSIPVAGDGKTSPRASECGSVDLLQGLKQWSRLKRRPNTFSPLDLFRATNIQR